MAFSEVHFKAKFGEVGVYVSESHFQVGSSSEYKINTVYTQHAENLNKDFFGNSLGMWMIIRPVGCGFFVS